MKTYPSDRVQDLLEITNSDYPLSPLTVSCASAFDVGSIDVWWSNPGLLSINTEFNLVGVNVYRSFDSEYGPYEKMNAYPIESQLYRDRIVSRLSLEEDVSNRFVASYPTDAERNWIFKVKNVPIHIQPTVGRNSIPLNMFVTVDGVPAQVTRIDATKGEVTLGSEPYFDVVNQRQFPPVLPGLNSIVLASYRYLDGVSKTSLMRRVFYKVTTVATTESGEELETPLSKASICNNQQVEAMDWIWREAIRRNRWILEQGGERVKVFIRKSVGTPCGCTNDTHKQASADCTECFGTGIFGGYEGPFDIIIAPDDAEKKSEQSNRGRSFIHTYETWTGPSPLLSQRDFIIKLNGDRYGIGPVRMPSNRGNQLQQFFNISHIDETDIRYRVPVLDTSSLVIPKTKIFDQTTGNSTPMVTERTNIGDEREYRGNTVTWQNHERR